MSHIYLILCFLLLLLIGYIVYNSLIPTTDLIVIIVCCMLFYKLSRYSAGNDYDKDMTLLILIVCFSVYYVSYHSLINISGYSINNPFVLIYLLLQFLLYFILIVSRYSTLNFIKVLSWVIGLSTILMFVFTIVIYSSIEMCYMDQNETQLYDSNKNTMTVYFLWLVAILVLGLFEEYKTIYVHISPILIIVSVGIAIYLVSLASDKCKTTDEQIKQLTDVKTKKTMFGIIDDPTNAITSGPIEQEAEKLTITKEYSWINNSIRLLTVVSYICLILGHVSSAIWYSFLSYYMLSNCGPVGDSRKYPVVFCILISLIYFLVSFIKYIYRSVRK